MSTVRILNYGYTLFGVIPIYLSRVYYIKYHPVYINGIHRCLIVFLCLESLCVMCKDQGAFVSVQVTVVVFSSITCVSFSCLHILLLPLMRIMRCDSMGKGIYQMSAFLNDNLCCGYLTSEEWYCLLYHFFFVQF